MKEKLGYSVQAVNPDIDFFTVFKHSFHCYLYIKGISLCPPLLGDDIAIGSPCLSVRYKAVGSGYFLRP